MGWFDEQIRQRMENDEEVFRRSMEQMAGVVMGKSASMRLDDSLRTKGAIDEILRFYRIKSHELPEGMRDVNDQLEFLMRPAGVMRRKVQLTPGWYKHAVGAMLAFRSDGTGAVALIPQGVRGYTFWDAATGKRQRVSRTTELLFEPDALCFYKPYPLKKLSFSELAKYIAGCLSWSDYLATALASLAVAGVGLILPYANNVLFSTVVDSGSVRLLGAVAILLLGATVSALLIGVFKSQVLARIKTKMQLAVDCATMMRLISLPASFFKAYSAGDLASRAALPNLLCELLVEAVLETGLTSLFSLVYIGQIFAYAPALAVPAVLILVITGALSVTGAAVQTWLYRNRMENAAKENGLNFGLVAGIQKIKLAGAEKRGFAKWAALHTKTAYFTYGPPAFLGLSAIVSGAVLLFGTIVLYWSAVTSGVSVADYYAFNTAYGVVAGAFLAMSGMTTTIAYIKPVFELIRPIVEALPEVSEGKQVVTRLSGGVELSNVSFRYRENMPLVLENLSLKIRPGQYVAIVGRTGCGKSTLMRLLLGFETPQRGAVYYDGKDLASIDQRSLRRQIGSVMQNGKLFQGDIFSNITITAPWLTLHDAWQAAELAGVAEDIRAMPMGMHTVLSEGGCISGGQRQRIMIARAIAGKPKLLLFDEATSALDNITQRVVSDSLAQLKCTRIVIAHRLSTIRQCDRVVLLDGGRIVEDGTYDELLAQGGAFAKLVKLQRLDSDPVTQPAQETF